MCYAPVPLPWTEEALSLALWRLLGLTSAWADTVLPGREKAKRLFESGYFERMLAESKRTYRIPLITWPSPLLRPLRVRLNRTAVDLGVNVGSFSKAYGGLFNSVVGIDASSACISQARLNLAGMSNIRLIHGILSDVSGKDIALRRVYVGGGFESKDFTSISWDQDEVDRSDFQGRLGEIEEVAKSISWEDVVREAAGRIDFLKCDIEGAEYELFWGKDLSMVGVLVMELHYTGLGQKRSRDLVRYLEKFFDYLDPQEAVLFKSEWPPPDILRMVRRGSQSGKRIALAWTKARQLIRLIRQLKRSLWPGSDQSRA